MDLLTRTVMQRLASQSNSRSTGKSSNDDAVSLHKPSKKFIQYISSTSSSDKPSSKSSSSKSSNKKVPPPSHIDTNHPAFEPMVPPTSESSTSSSGKPSSKSSSPVGTSSEKEEIESRLISISSQGGIAGQIASSVLSAGVEKEKEQYGELATEEYEAKKTESALRQSLSDLVSGFVRNVKQSKEIEKNIVQTYGEAIGNIDKNIDYIKKHGIEGWYEYGGKRYRGSDLIRFLQSEKWRLEEEKEEKLKELTEYRRKNFLSFLRGAVSIVGNLSRISSYLDKVRSLKAEGAYAIRGEGGGLIIFSSKKEYEKWKFFEREKQEWEKLEERASKGDILASLQLTGKRLLTGFGSFEGLSSGIKLYFSGVSPYRAAASRALGKQLTGREEKALGQFERDLKRSWSTLLWKWEHSDILGKAGMVIESPAGIMATSLVGGAAAGAGIGAVSRIAPTAGKIAKAGLAGAGVVASGTAGYDVYRTATIEKDISKALAKGLIYGFSFYGAGKLFRAGYQKGYEKAHIWWTSRYKPTFKTVIMEKMPIEEGKIAFKGFQEWEYKYSLGRRIHSTIYFEGTFSPEKNPQFRPIYGSYFETPKGRVFLFEGVMPEGEGITFSKGVGRIEYGIFRTKSKVFEIIPKISRGESIKVFRLAAFSGKKGGAIFSVHTESRFISRSQEELSLGRVIFGKTKPLRWILMKFKGKPIYIESTEYIQRGAWTKGFTYKEDMLLPTRATGKIIEARGFTRYGSKNFSFFSSRGKSTGKSPLSTLFKTDIHVGETVPLRPPVGVGKISEFKIPSISKQINAPFRVITGIAEKPTFKPLLIPPFSLLFPSSSQSIKPISFRIGLPKLLDISIPKSFDISTPTINQSPGIIDVTDVASLYRTDTDIAQSTTPIYDFVEEQIQPVKTTRKTRTRITPGEQDIFLPTIEFGFKPTPFSKIEMFAKGYRYRKWKVMKIEDLLFGR